MFKIYNAITRRLISVFKDVFLNSVIGAKIIPEEIRRTLYKLFGIEIGKARIRPGCFFEGHSLRKVKIGNGVFINNHCFFSCNADLIIEDNCTIALEVSFCTSTHELGTQEQRAGKAIGRPIHVGNGTWIGTRATILPGVNIGKGCVIAAGAVVNKDCESNCIYGGIPAKKIKEIAS